MQNRTIDGNKKKKKKKNHQIILLRDAFLVKWSASAGRVCLNTQVILWK